MWQGNPPSPRLRRTRKSAFAKATADKENPACKLQTGFEISLVPLRGNALLLLAFVLLGRVSLLGIGGRSGTRSARSSSTGGRSNTLNRRCSSSRFSSFSSIFGSHFRSARYFNHRNG